MTNIGFSPKSTNDYMQSFNNKVNNIVNPAPAQQSFYTPTQTQSGLSQEVEAAAKDYVKGGNLQQDQKTQGFGAANWAQAGIGAVNSLIGLGLGAWQTKIAEDERKAKEKQRQIENERYNQQKAYHEKGINDAANTASGLKSASANVSSPQQNTAQAANNPPQANAQAQNPPPANTPPQEDLPMQRQ